MMRLLGALLVGTTVIVAAALLFDSLASGGAGWLAVVMIAMVAASLVDRERFYGPSDRRDARR